MTWRDRLRAGWHAFQTPPKPLEGEFAFADPRRLFPGGAFTQYNPSWLVGRKGLQIFDQMRRDDQIKAALAFKKHSILATGWTVTSPEGEPEDWEPTAFVRWVLDNLDKGEPGGGTVDGDLYEIMTALDYGVSVTEKIWLALKTGPWAGRICLTALKTRAPHDFTFEQDECGRFKPDGLLQAGNTAVKDGRLPMDKFVLWTYQPRFGNPYGVSDLEAAYRAWWIKDNAYKWLAILLERLGIPPVFGLYNPNRYSPAQIDDLKKIFQNLQAATFGILPRPEPGALDFWSPELAGQATRVFVPALDMLNKDLARALLMPGLLGITPDAQQGSFARARVHFDVFLLVIEALRKELETVVMMHQVVKPLVDLNFPGVAAYPKWAFLPLTEEIRADLLERWAILIGARVVTPQAEDEAHIRAILKFPERQEPGPESEPLLQLFAQTRVPDRYERAVDFARIERGLDGLQREAVGRLRELLGGTRETLLGYVERNFVDVSPGFVERLRLQGMPDIRDTAQAFLLSAYQSGRDSRRRELPRRFQGGPTFAPQAALRYLSELAVRISGVLSARLLDDAKQILLNALKFGEPQRETLRKLRDLFEPYLGDEDLIRDDQVVEPWRLETILRTNATGAFNQGRLVEARDPDLEGFIRGMRYSTVLDTRRTRVCKFLDRMAIPMDEPELDRLTPPNHYNCRSLLVALPVGVEIDEADLITPSEIGTAKELIQKGFK